MSLSSLPPVLRATTSRFTITRPFSTTPPRLASVLFALHALSNSRETQHFNTLSQLNRIEHSPPLKLIKTSEVDPYPLPALPPKPAAVPLVRLGGARSAARVWDDKALKVGRTVLADHARHTSRLQQALERVKRRETRQVLRAQAEKAAWQQEVRRHHREMKAAGVWILLSIGTATALATWRFWPQQRQTDSGELGRRLAATAQRNMPLPRAVVGDAATATSGVAAAAMQKAAAPAPAVEPALASLPSSAALTEAKPQTASWWKSLFWKQQ